MKPQLPYEDYSFLDFTMKYYYGLLENINHIRLIDDNDERYGKYERPVSALMVALAKPADRLNEIKFRCYYNE